MKSFKKFVAALLVLTMVLAMSSVAFAAKAKFTKKDIGTSVEFTGSLYGYDKHCAYKKSNVIVKKGSIAIIKSVYGKKWVELELTEDGKVTKWFGVDKLKGVADMPLYARVIFGSGGAGISKPSGDISDVVKAYKNKKVKTTGKVKMHKNPSLSGKKLLSVPKGKKVTLTGRVGMDNCGVLFFEAKYKGKKGFISMGYLNVKTAAGYEALSGGGDSASDEEF